MKEKKQIFKTTQNMFLTKHPYQQQHKKRCNANSNQKIYKRVIGVSQIVYKLKIIKTVDTSATKLTPAAIVEEVKGRCAEVLRVSRSALGSRAQRRCLNSEFDGLYKGRFGLPN